MARLAILGASGKLGDLLVGRALELGHAVNALARDPRKIRRQNEQLTVIAGDATTGQGLDALVERAAFVVCAVGGLLPVVEATMTQLLKALAARRPIDRLVLVSRLGAGDSRGQSAMASGPLQSRLPVLLPTVFRDLNAAEGLLRVGRVPYTIVRATRLTDDAPSGSAVWTSPTVPPPHRISRADLARSVLDALEDPQLLNKEVTVGSK